MTNNVKRYCIDPQTIGYWGSKPGEFDYLCSPVVVEEDFDLVVAERDALLSRVAHLTAALQEIAQTPIHGNHGKLQAIGMRATAKIALEADAKSTQAKPDFSMIGTEPMPPMEYDEP